MCANSNSGRIICENIKRIEDGEDVKDWLKNEINRLVKSKEIPSQLQLKCEAHGKYLALPIAIVGKEVWYSFCPKCQNDRKKEEDRYLRLKKQEQELKKIEQLKYRGVPNIFFEKKIDYSVGVFEKYAHLLKNQLKNNLFIFGSVGTGKSSFAYELCKRYYEMDKIAVVVNANILLGKYKSNYSNIEYLQNVYQYVDCLIVDELDNIKETDFQVIDDLISIFYDQCKKIVFIGNTDLNNFKASLSPKSVSRLKENTLIITCKGKDLRSKK